MTSKIVAWMSEGHLNLVIVLSISILLFLCFIKGIRSQSNNSNRSVSVGRDNYGVINTGDSNKQPKHSLLATLANISTILALIVSLFGAYLSYLTMS